MKAPTEVKLRLSARTNAQLIMEWDILEIETITQEVAEVRGWYMEEIEKRWPSEFNDWIDSEDPNVDIHNFIKV